MEQSNIYLLVALAVSGVLGFFLRSLWAGVVPAILMAAVVSTRSGVGSVKDAGWMIGLPLMAAGPYLVFGLVGAAIGRGIKEKNSRLLKIIVGTVVGTALYLGILFYFR